MTEMSLKRDPLGTIVSNCASPRALRCPWDKIYPMSPRLLDQFFNGRISCLLQRLDLEMPCSLTDALEQAMLVVEPSSEQKSEGNMRQHGRDVEDTPERRIIKRVVDGIIVKELVRSMHRASCHATQLFDHCPYFLRIVREKLCNGIRHRQFSSLSKAFRPIVQTRV